MMIGDTSRFAIESSITTVSERIGIRGIGYFAIHLGGYCYGNRTDDSTTLACSFQEVGDRLIRRGSHTAPFGRELPASKIADAMRSALYSDNPTAFYLNMPLEQLSDTFYSNHLIWAPDGDEAFDDGSYVLQFDIDNQVRLIGFQSNESYLHNPDSLRDITLHADEFYSILREWHSAFEFEWARLLAIDSG